MTSQTEITSPRSQAATDIQSVAMVSLGCPKNLVDSEKMLGLLAEAGLAIAPEDDAEAIIINTCGFLEASKEESVEEINAAIALKEAGAVRRVIVAGCLVQRHRAKLLEWCPGIDAMIGVFDRDRIVEAVRGPATASATNAPRAGSDVAVELPVYSSIAANAAIAKQHRAMADADHEGYYESDAARLRITPRHYAYLRMSEGCNQACAFCTIPAIRGKMRSKPVPALLAELRELIQDGAFEINLIGQDTTSYGKDIGYEPGLVGLLHEIDDCITREAGPGNAWVRLMYAYPSAFTDEMIGAIASLPSIVKYIDMPLQHISDRVLDSMRRHTSRALIETLLGKLRQRVPGIAIRTTFITGFPGETADEHRELLQFISDFGFDHLGVFPYSYEPETRSGRMHRDGQAVRQNTIDRRYDELMRAQQQVVFTRNARLVDDGATYDVLIDQVEGETEEGLQLSTGRGWWQAPQVDSTTLVLSEGELSPGEVLPCRAVDMDGYDLVARPLEEIERKTRLPVLG